MMSNFLLPGGARGQSISVPLGRAAQFGLLSGGNISTDTTAVAAWGKAGAAGTMTSHVSATDSLLASGAGSVGGALADLQAAMSYCQSLTAQTVTLTTIAKPTPAGIYQFAGNVQLDSATQLHLLGTASTWHIFRINGNLTVQHAGAVTLDDSVRADHVIWVVTGNVVQSPLSTLPGMVMAGGNATVTNIQFGAQTLWSLGSISFSQQEPTLGRWAYAAPQWLSGNPTGPLTSCVPARNCDPVLGRNEVANNSAEHFNPPFINQLSNMELGRSNVNCWEAAVAGTVMTPDYFNDAAPTSGPLTTAIPSNAFGIQLARTWGDHAYMGFYASARRGLTINDESYTFYYHDYIRQVFAPDFKLVAGRWYYGEFYVSRSERSSLPVPPDPNAIPKLRLDVVGMYLSEELPQERWFDQLVFPNPLPPPLPPPAPLPAHNLAAQMRIVPPGGTYATSPAAIPQIRFAESPLTNTTDWVRVSGCFQATGRERCAVIGSYRDWQTGPSTSSDGAYYYLDDISMSAFPKPFIEAKEVNCGEEVTFGFTDCLLPASSQAEYQWLSDGAPASPWLPTPDYTAVPTQSAQYWLNIRVPIAGSPGAFQTTKIPAGEVTVTTPTCQYDCQKNVAQALDLLFPSYKIPGGTTLPEHTVFYVNHNLKLTGGTVIIPEGTLLLMAPNTHIELENATLRVEGGTITAACFDLGLWNGIIVDDATSGVYTTASSNNRLAEISGMSNGINLNVGPTLTGTFNLTDTRFLHNRHTLSSLLPLTSAAPTGTILRCTFDADPALIGGYAPEWHLRLSGDRTQTAITSSTFDHAAFGLFAPEPLRIGTSTATPFRDNIFRNQYLAGIYMAARGATATDNALYIESNTFEFPEQANASLEVDMPVVLALVENVDPGQQLLFNQPSTYGVFTERVALIMNGNTFKQPVQYADYNYIGTRTRQVGAYVQFAPSAIIETNDFISLHEGLVGLSANRSYVRNNLFDDCKIGAHVLAVNSSVPVSPVCLDCNSFMRSYGLGPMSLFGVSYGVLIDAGARVSFNRFDVTSSAPSDRVLGNQFRNEWLSVSQMDPTTTPATAPNFKGFDNAIVNNATTPLRYLTYDDDEPDYNPATYNMDLAHAPAALLKHWPGNNNYYGSTNVTVETPNSPSQPFPSPFQVTSTNDCASQGLGFTRGLMERSASTGGITSSTGKAKEAVAVITCFPNPAEDHTMVRYTLPRSGQTARLEVRDLMGRVVLTQVLDVRATAGETSLGLMTAPDGILICQLVVDGTVRASQRLGHRITAAR
jgi:Ice-binding-like